jgi:hypothetical protein
MGKMDNRYVIRVRAAGLREFPHESLASLFSVFTRRIGFVLQ